MSSPFRFQDCYALKVWSHRVCQKLGHMFCYDVSTISALSRKGKWSIIFLRVNGAFLQQEEKVKKFKKSGLLSQSAKIHLACHLPRSLHFLFFILPDFSSFAFFHFLSFPLVLLLQFQTHNPVQFSNYNILNFNIKTRIPV